MISNTFVDRVFRFGERCPDRVDDWCYACRARKY